MLAWRRYIRYLLCLPLLLSAHLYAPAIALQKAVFSYNSTALCLSYTMYLSGCDLRLLCHQHVRSLQEPIGYISKHGHVRELCSIKQVLSSGSQSSMSEPT